MGFSFYIADPVRDRDIILKLWKANIQVDDFDKRYEWLYSENPAGPMRTVLAVHEKTEEVVGAGSLYPQKALLFGKPIIIGTAADYMVDKRYRVFGPALQIQRKLLESASDFGFDCLLGYPNQAAKGVIKRIGYKPLGFAHRYVKPLKTHELLASRIKPAVLSVVLARVLDILLLCEDSLKSFFSKFKYQSLLTDAVKNIEIDVNGTKFFSSKVTFDKAQEKLVWRYQQNKFSFFSISAKPDSHADAFIVYQVNDNVVSIIDIISLDEKFLEPLLKLFISAMYKAHNTRISIQFLGDRTLINLLKKLRFYIRESDRSCYLFFNQHLFEPFEGKILDDSNWFIFESDMDI